VRDHPLLPCTPNGRLPGLTKLWVTALKYELRGRASRFFIHLLDFTGDSADSPFLVQGESTRIFGSFKAIGRHLDKISTFLSTFLAGLSGVSGSSFQNESGSNSFSSSFTNNWLNSSSFKCFLTADWNWLHSSKLSFILRLLFKLNSTSLSISQLISLNSFLFCIF